MSTVDLATFKAHAEELVAKAIAGEATVIEQNGKRAVLLPCEGLAPDFELDPQTGELLRQGIQAPGGGTDRGRLARIAAEHPSGMNLVVKSPSGATSGRSDCGSPETIQTQRISSSRRRNKRLSCSPNTPALAASEAFHIRE